MTPEQQALVVENLDLVGPCVGVAMRGRYECHRDDVISDAHYGLVDAAHKWDPLKGGGVDRFRGWARWVMKMRIRDGFRVRTGMRQGAARRRKVEEISLEAIADGVEISVDELNLMASCDRSFDDLLNRMSWEAFLDMAAEVLDYRHFVVLSWFDGESSMADLGEALGVTESRISQMCAEVGELLRHEMLRRELVDGVTA